MSQDLHPSEDSRGGSFLLLPASGGSRWSGLCLCLTWPSSLLPVSTPSLLPVPLRGMFIIGLRALGESSVIHTCRDSFYIGSHSRGPSGHRSPTALLSGRSVIKAPALLTQGQPCYGQVLLWDVHVCSPRSAQSPPAAHWTHLWPSSQGTPVMGWEFKTKVWRKH